MGRIVAAFVPEEIKSVSGRLFQRAAPPILEPFSSEFHDAINFRERPCASVTSTELSKLHTQDWHVNPFQSTEVPSAQCRASRMAMSGSLVWKHDTPRSFVAIHLR